MSDPIVTAVMLVNGREAMVRRALKSFRSQTYKNKRLMIYDTGWESPEIRLRYDKYEGYDCNRGSKDSIGTLRNKANALVTSDVLIHWDSDDWSHPERMAEQVAFLQSSGAECVGYHDMICLDTTPGQFAGAWQYSSAVRPYCMGTSMCYWRAAWNSVPFAGTNDGCDDLWWRDRVVMESVTSQGGGEHMEGNTDVVSVAPRMIVSIHGGNRCARIAEGFPEWTRLPHMDKWTREAMA